MTNASKILLRVRITKVIIANKIFNIGNSER